MDYPASVPGVGLVGGKFVDEDAGTGQVGSLIPAAWGNAVTDEILSVIQAAGLDPDEGDVTQLLAAITAFLRGRVVLGGTTTGAAPSFALALAPALAAYAEGVRLRVKFHAAGSGADVLNVNGLGNKSIKQYDAAGTKQAAVIAAGLVADVEYDGVDFVVLDALAPGAIQGAFSNLKLSAAGTGPSIAVSYDDLVLGNGSGGYVSEHNVAGTITTTTVGAGGLDAGVLAASTWYSIWRIGKADGARNWLFSLSATSPTMPAGYTLKARIGWFRTDSTANKYPLSFIQSGRSVRYKPAAGSNLTLTPQMASGVAGTIGTTLVAAAVGAFVPPTASIIKLQTYTGGGGAVQVNSSSVASITGTTGFDNTVPTGATPSVQGELMLESTNIYWASNFASSAIYCSGWEDNL
ncbi:hypothetical protein GPA19_07940 [Azoarcus indigens]|uniref:Phage tail protein n=1 Tax=Azoarcus indigens TaxID=29545 RepID=A0A4V3BMF1_9RHOO|nr:hypothetical protein [Azoarcus indigens]NMG64874.1 hypothetical protein [Azoarcus indigens]TDN50412.1 hypothetical protein C7389_109106 [Azoarcus indigens]